MEMSFPLPTLDGRLLGGTASWNPALAEEFARQENINSTRTTGM